MPSTPTRTPRSSAANAWLWCILCVIFGPLALMLLYILPKHEPVHAAGHAAKKSDPHDALYEVPKKHH